MSILIRGLDMPNKKNGAVLIIYPNGDAVFEDGYHYKAVPVPPHGDLIDRDTLKPYMLNEHYKHRLVFDADEVANAPTIIPEEEGE